MPVPEKLYIKAHDVQDNERLLDDVIDLADKLNELIDHLSQQQKKEEKE